MRVVLDDNAIQPDGPGVRAALDAARDLADRAGRLVIEVWADGSPADAALVNDPPADAAGIRELRVVSAPAGAFLRETLLDAGDALVELKGLQRAAAEKIQRGDLPAAADPLGRALESWGVVRDVVEKSAQILGIGLDVVHLPGGGTAAGAAEELAAGLTRVRDAVATADWGGLSDELAFDLDASADRWREVVTTMAARAESLRAETGTGGARWVGGERLD